MIDQFINFNKNCPMCGNNLTFFIQFTNSICFKGVKIDEKLTFDQFKCVNDKYAERLFSVSGNNFFFTSNKDDFAGKSFYMFALCNPNSFIKKILFREDEDYDISLYKSCYFRSTPFLELKNDLSVKLTGEKELLHKNESFATREKKETEEIVYFINFEYEEEKTYFWYYSVPDAEKENTYFEPKLFDKILPLPRKRFNLSDRKWVMNKLNGWMLMS